MNSEETTLFTAIIITAVTLGIIIFYFFISIIAQQRRNLALQRENLRIEINAMEHERTRIANDLHDDISPILSVVRFQINSIHIGDAEDQKQVRLASDYLDGLISRLREISNNLMPASLLRKGLIVSIGEFLRNVEASAKLHTTFSHTDAINISQEKSIQIYRIVQELVHNSIRHAAATKLTVQLETRNNDIFIAYADNGAGFDVTNTLKTASGFGLRSLKSRTDLLCGTMQITSKPNQGTQFIFQIPIA